MFLKCLYPKDVLLKCLKHSPPSEHPSPINMSTSPKHCWNLHVYPISFWDKLSRRTSLLVRSEFLGLIVDKLTAGDKSCNHNRKNFSQSIQTQLSKKPKNNFSSFHSAYKIYIKFWISWKKDKPHSSIISETINSKRRGYIPKTSSFRALFCIQRANGPQILTKKLRELFFHILHHSEKYWVGKILS